MARPISAEAATYVDELRWVLDQVVAILADYPPQRLNWRPATGTANSAYAIASHVASCTRVYALGFGCGQEVQRDREAEFAATGTDARQLIADLRDLSGEIATALEQLPPAALDRRLSPPQHLWGTGRARESSAREAIVESIRHAALHLGELRLTRDLSERQRSRT